MLLQDALAKLTKLVAHEKDTVHVLNNLAKAALELTSSRNALIAVLDSERGHLEVRFGAGHDFTERALGKVLQVDVAEEEGIVAYVAATGKSLFAPDVTLEPRYRKMFDTTASEVAVPIRDSVNRTRAVLNAESERLDAYGEAERQTLEIIADFVALVLDREEAERREEALIAVGSSLDRSQTEKDLLNALLAVAGDVLHFQAFSIFLKEPESDEFVLRGTTGLLEDKVGEISYRPGDGVTGWVLQHAQAMLLDDPQSDPRWRGLHMEFAGDEISSFMAAPVVQRGKAVGALRALRRKPDNPYLDNRFTQADCRMLQAIAEQVATALENIRSFDKSLRAERMIAWGELSAKSSHMIGNRVFALKGDVNELGHLLQETPLDVKSVSDLQASLQTNVNRIEEILQEFRDFVTATQIKREEVDLNELLNCTVQEVFPKRSRVSLKLELTSDLPKVLGDRAKLQRAFSELIENAVSFMDEGSLALRASLEDGRPNFVRVEVEDTGPGVNPEQRALIFKPFYSSRSKGMGLGLSIVKGIVDAHGGDVYEAGESGHGAKFVVLLPGHIRP
jgi:signal transduction histidine kinase